MNLATSVLLTLVAGSLVYCVLVIIACWRYLRQGRPQSMAPMGISILKPLNGLDEGLEQNLETFFVQDYERFEILFAVRDDADPACAVIERLRARHPNVAARLIVTGEPPYANAKVFSLSHMVEAAEYDLLVMSDSDIRVDRAMLRAVAAEFADPNVGLATCPYRAIAGSSVWSQLEAVGMNTEFFGGVLTARMLEGMRFAVGPTIVARKQVLRDISAFDIVKDYLAEDFVMGRRAAERDIGVILSSYVVEHRIGSERLGSNFAHRLRWTRSTRRSRPAGYVGQIFTYTLPLALLLTIAAPVWWPLLIPTVMLRAAAAYAVAGPVLHAGTQWHLLIVQDLLSFGFWIAGFFGNTIRWRGRDYELLRDGRFVLKR